MGNRLFFWARCRIFAHRHGAQMIAPLWFRPAIGPLLRGGIDYRTYLKRIVLFRLFQRRSDDLRWIYGLWNRMNPRCLKLHEDDLDQIHSNSLPKDHPVHILFDCPIFSFSPLNGWELFLLRELQAITRKKYIDFVDSFEQVPIGVNVRCGNDFKEAPDDPSYTRVGWLQKTPISWYQKTIAVIRESLGYPAKVLLVSDGTEEMLEELLKMENVIFLRPGTAITDLLILSRSRVLIGTSSSTFSAWACFLGQMPTISAPGHPLSEWGIENRKGQYIGEFNPHTPNQAFLEQVSAVLSTAH